MPTIMHHYTFTCVRCGCIRQTQLRDDDYLTGRVKPTDVTNAFAYGASLDFSDINSDKMMWDDIKSMADRMRKVNGDLCDGCLESLVEWFDE